MENYLTNEDLILKIRLNKKELVDELYERNQAGIYKVTRDFYKKHYQTLKQLGCYDFDDLLQLSNIYFIESVDKYDFDKGVKYITFMMNYIQWMLTLHFFKHGKIKSNLKVEYNKASLFDDVKDLSGDTNENMTMPDGGWCVPVYIEDYDNHIITDEAIETLTKQRDKDIITDYYLNGLNDEDISNKYDFKTPKVARQSISRIIAKIRRNYKEFI